MNNTHPKMRKKMVQLLNMKLYTLTGTIPKYLNCQIGKNNLNTMTRIRINSILLNHLAIDLNKN